MLENLSVSIRECHRHAEDCERQAALQTDPASRKDFLDSAQRWIKLAHSYELAERLSRFTYRPANGSGITAFLRARDSVFDDAATRIMGEALDAACAFLGNISGPSREAVADRIIVAATSGERDPARLREAGMAVLRPRPR